MDFKGVALLGQPGAGKTSVASAICLKLGGIRVTFAAALKDELATMLGDYEYHIERMQNVLYKDSYRPLQQALGAFRRVGDEDYWVRKVVQYIHQDSFYVSDDCRYWNEYKALKEAGFAIVLLLPGPTVRPLTGGQAMHESERDWPTFDVDLAFGYIEGVDNMADAIIHALKIRGMNG